MRPIAGLTKRGEAERAYVPLRMLSYPENGEHYADPFASQLPAVFDRAEGGVLGRNAFYPRPAASSPALQHLLGADRE